MRRHTSSNTAYCKIPHKRAGLKAPSAIHGPLSLVFYSIDKPNIIADCLENQFSEHDLSDCGHMQHVEAQVKSLLTTVDEDTPVNIQPCDVSKGIQYGIVSDIFGLDTSRHIGRNSAETRQRPKMSPKFRSDQPRVVYEQTIGGADFKNNPKTQRGNKLTKYKSVWLSSRSWYDTSMYEAGGSRHPKFQQ
jgi:hypothetical protein